jgi:hypothetical protein
MSKNKQLYRRSTKGQVMLTLNWIVAFILIFFIILVFLFLTGILSSKKVLTLKSNSLENENGLPIKYNQELLFTLLNTPVSGELVKDKILRWKNENNPIIKEEISNYFREFLEKNMRSECYLFLVDYGSFKNSEEYIFLDNPKSDKNVNKPASSDSNAELIIFAGNIPIKIKLYERMCIR